MAEKLFTYGTLNVEHPPAEVGDLLARFVLVEGATVRGRLYQLDAYPGLVLDAAAEPVTGQVFEVPDEAWKRLDAYEGFDPEVRESSLFLRERAEVQLASGASESVWIYVYNRHTAE